MWNARLNETQAGIKIAGRKINLRYADDTTVMAESEEELKSLLMRVKEKSEKASWKLNIQKTKIMASGLACPITSWQTPGEKVETVTDFTFLDSKIMLDGDCGMKLKDAAPWKESYDKPRQSIQKQRHHFANKGLYRQSYGFSSGHVQIWDLDHKEGWALTNRYFQITVLEKTWESHEVQGG